MKAVELSFDELKDMLENGFYYFTDLVITYKHYQFLIHTERTRYLNYE